MLRKYTWFLILPFIFMFTLNANAQDQQQTKVEPPQMSLLESETEIPCKVIRQVRYPVTKTEPYKQPLRIALLNLCPKDIGAEARPMLTFFVKDEPVMREYVVEKVFKDEKEAKKYAKKNKIKDVSF
jgi:hypothetical protein